MLQERLQYGAKADITELCAIGGVKAHRARLLCAHRISTVEDIAAADPELLAEIFVSVGLGGKLMPLSIFHVKIGASCWEG
mgnify:CR=1 FL=1